MKIILALFGFFLTARCLPAPGVTSLQECEGSKCHSSAAFGSGFDTAAADVAFKQRCKDGKCNKASAFGVDFSDSFSDNFWDSSSSDSDTWNIQNCQGSDCQSKTAFGRKKRGVFIGQECHGSKCHQKSGFGAGFDTAAADVAIKQRCKDGKCDKDSAFGVDFSNNFFDSSSSDSDTWSFANCQGSDCQQKTAFGRKKRGVFIGQECEGSKCHQKSAFGARFDTAAADVAIKQRCKDGKCDKDSAFGVDFSDNFSDDFFGSSSSDSDTWTIQRCHGSNCQQNNHFARGKRAVV